MTWGPAAPRSTQLVAKQKTSGQQAKLSQRIERGAPSYSRDDTFRDDNKCQWKNRKACDIWPCNSSEPYGMPIAVVGGATAANRIWSTLKPGLCKSGVRGSNRPASKRHSSR